MVNESSIVDFECPGGYYIVNAVKQHDSYFNQRRASSGRLGLSTLQKVIVAIRILAYGMPADATDEYIKIGESTAIECMKKFCRAIVEVFLEWYLRSPTTEHVARLFNIGQQRGFPGMLGTAPPSNYTIQGKEYNMGYYLADGIYPKWSTTVQTINDPQGPNKKLFAARQEACRKDGKQAFGVLLAKFVIVAGSSRYWKK
uniref:DDE Tnp4 domain-containing protein n=1 Tax=Brassica oleracea var. oleracea TaxID=109376 RepID=A0A0D3CFN2_BRAOL